MSKLKIVTYAGFRIGISVLAFISALYLFSIEQPLVGIIAALVSIAVTFKK